jgi:RHS repeat-associated protein
VASVVYPNGQNSNYSYYGNAGDHRLQTIHHKLANGVTLSKYDYTYDLGGNILTWQQQADTSAPTVWSYIYDADDRLVNAVRRSTDSTPVVLNRFAYGYDAEANRVTEQIDDAVSASDHDALNRLTGTQPGGQIRVVGTVSEPATVTIQGKPADVAADHTFVGQASLQAGSNVLTITAQDPSGNTQTNQYAVTAVGNTTTISYDANGNLTSDGTRTYTWDAQNRLVSQASATSGSEFTYDGRSRLVRVIEKTNGVIVNDRRLLWCDLDVCEERDAAGDTVLKRFFANGVLNVSTSQSTYLTRDHLGSIREAGASRFSYDPYGRMTQIAGSEGSDFGYGGLLNHSASGLVLAPYRAYNPGLGRWMSEDPTGLAAGSNRYAFADANPIRFADPLGLDGMDSVSRTIWELIKQGKYREARILLQDSDLALSQEAKKAIQEALKRLETPVRDLIRGRLKTSESYASELEEETFGDLLQSGSKKAKAMCKLVKDSLRLMGKGGDLR